MPTCTVRTIAADRRPRHAEIADRLRRSIVSGALAVGQPLPSEAQLCIEFDASRGTIRQALASLRHDGLITGGQGRAPVVAERAVRQPFDSLVSFSLWATRLGHTPGQRTIEIARRQADPLTADRLDIDVGDPVVQVLRLRLLDGVPTMLERATYADAFGRHLFDIDTDGGSIYEALIARGVDIHSARHTIDAVAADKTDAELLQVPLGSPLLRERRHARTSAGRPIEYGEDRYRPDLVAFTIDNRRATGGIPTPIALSKETP